MQDIFAVVFLAASSGKLPSAWALGLLVLIPIRFVLMHLLNRSRQSGELQVLYGLALAFGGYALFDAVDVKGDLGALIVGTMLASLPLAGDVSKRNRCCPKTNLLSSQQVSWRQNTNNS